MKYFLGLILVFIGRVFTGDGLVIECSIFPDLPAVKEIEHAPQVPPEKRGVDILIVTSIANKTEKTHSLATGAYVADVEHDGDAFLVTIRWFVPRMSDGTAFAYPGAAIGKVELRPGESTSFTARLAVRAEHISRIDKVLGEVSEEFAQRYAVEPLAWTYKIRRPKSASEYQNPKSQP